MIDFIAAHPLLCIVMIMLFAMAVYYGTPKK